SPQTAGISQPRRVARSSISLRRDSQPRRVAKREKVSGTFFRVSRTSARAERRFEPEAGGDFRLPLRCPEWLAAKQASAHRLLFGRTERCVDPCDPVPGTINRPFGQCG